MLTLFRKVSRNELLKALEDHAKVFNENGTIEWNNDGTGYYTVSVKGMTLFVSKFGINDTIPDMITMYQIMSMPVMGKDVSVLVMLGAIRSSDWMVEIKEEGEE